MNPFSTMSSGGKGYGEDQSRGRGQSCSMGARQGLSGGDPGHSPQPRGAGGGGQDRRDPAWHEERGARLGDSEAGRWPGPSGRLRGLVSERVGAVGPPGLLCGTTLGPGTMRRRDWRCRQSSQRRPGDGGGGGVSYQSLEPAAAPGLVQSSVSPRDAPWGPEDRPRPVPSWPAVVPSVLRLQLQCVAGPRLMMVLSTKVRPRA